LQGLLRSICPKRAAVELHSLHACGHQRACAGHFDAAGALEDQAPTGVLAKSGAELILHKDYALDLPY